MRGRSTQEHDCRRGCEDAPRENAIFSENVRLYTRTRFQARMRGRSTRERDFRRECEDAPRESTTSGEDARTLHARMRLPGRMRRRSTQERDFRRECEDAPRESALPARMRGRSTRERDFQRECEDAPRESAIFSETARTLHAGTRFPTRIFASRAANPARRTAVFTGRVTILLFFNFSNSTVTALANKNARTLHARARFPARM